MHLIPVRLPGMVLSDFIIVKYQPVLNLMVRIRVNFKIRVRFRFRAPVKDRVRVRVVFRGRIQFHLLYSGAV